MKSIFLIGFLFFCLGAFAQKTDQLSTIDFVEVLNGNHAEAAYYYQHNWKELREMAVKRGYIASFQILETEPSAEAPFHLMLITTYANRSQYDQREPHFQELIRENGELKLLNELKPADFRKTLFGKEAVAHWH